MILNLLRIFIYNHVKEPTTMMRQKRWFTIPVILSTMFCIRIEKI